MLRKIGGASPGPGVRSFYPLLQCPPQAPHLGDLFFQGGYPLKKKVYLLVCGHFNHPDDPLNGGDVQGEFPVVQTECNQFTQSLLGLFSYDSSSDYR